MHKLLQQFDGIHKMHNWFQERKAEGKHLPRTEDEVRTIQMADSKKQQLQNKATERSQKFEHQKILAKRMQQARIQRPTIS